MENLQEIQETQKIQEENSSVSDFFKKFIVNFILGAFLIGIVIGLVNDIITNIPLPSALQVICSFLLGIFGNYFIASSAIKTSLKEVLLKPDDIKPLVKKMNLFLLILLGIDITLEIIPSIFSLMIFSSFGNFFIVTLLARMISTVLHYIFVMMVCKNTLESSVTGKEISKIPYLILVLVAIILIALTMFLGNL